MKIQTKEALKGLNGKPIKNGEDTITVGLVLSNILCASSKTGQMKLYILAQKIFNDKVVEVDKADLDLIKQEIESTKMYNVLFTGQLLVILSEDQKNK